MTELKRSPLSVKSWQWLLLALLCLMASVFVLYFTRLSPGMSGDSIWFVMGAENLASGGGYSRIGGEGELIPISGFPPVYSTLLAGMELIGVGAVQGARWLNAALFAVNGYLIWLLLQRYTRTYWVSLGGALLYLGRTTLVKYHSWVMTEPLYIFLQLLIFLLILDAVQTGRRGMILSAAIATGAGILTRYVGFSLLFSGALTLLLFQGKPLRERVLSTLAFVGIAMAPVAAWFARNSALKGDLINRTLSYHPIRPELLETYRVEIQRWFLFHRLIPFGAGFLAAVIAAGVGPVAFVIRQIRSWLSSRSWNLRNAPVLPWMLLFYSVAFLGILAANSLFLDAATTPSAPERYLAPLYASSILLILTTSYDLVRSTHSIRILPWAAGGLLGGFVLLHLGASVVLFRPEGVYLGYPQIKAENPGIVETLEKLTSERVIYTDNTEQLYALIGKTSFFVPVKFNRYTQQDNPGYAEQLEEMARALQAGGRLITFDELEQDREGISDQLNLRLIESFNGIDVYRWGAE